jgi:hypothetical protein
MLRGNRIARYTACTLPTVLREQEYRAVYPQATRFDGQICSRATHLIYSASIVVWNRVLRFLLTMADKGSVYILELTANTIAAA